MLDRYKNALGTIPAPGTGCHPALLSVANLGILGGLEPDQVHSDIAQAIPPGRRRVSDREIADAIRKALSDHRGGIFIPKPRPAPAVKDGRSALQRIIAQSGITFDEDLWESSPIRLWGDPGQDATLLLETLFKPDDLVFIGDRHEPGILGRTIRPAS